MTYHSRTAVRVLAMALALVFALGAALTPVKASADGGSAEFILSDSTMDISAKLFADPDNFAFALLAAMSSEGSEFANAGIHLTPEGISFSSEPFLDQAYGIHFASFEEYLPKSIFAPNSGSAFALDEETYAGILSGIAGFKSGANSVAVTAPAVDDAKVEQMQAVVERYAEMITELVTGHVDVHVAPETLTVDDQTVETSCMTLSMNSEALAALTDGVLSAAVEDAELKDTIAYLYQVGQQTAAAQGQNAQLPGVEIIDTLWEQLPSLREEALEAFQSSDYKLEISVNTSKRTGSPIRLQAILSVDDSSLGIRCTLSEDFGPTGNLLVELVEDGETTIALILQLVENGFGASIGMDDGTGYAIMGKIMQDTEETFSAGLSLVESGVNTNTIVLMFNLDRVNDRVTFTLNDNGSESSITCLVTEVDDDVVIVLENVNGEPLEENVRMVLHGTDTVTAPDFTEILTMSEEEFAALVQTVMETVNSIAG